MNDLVIFLLICGGAAAIGWLARITVYWVMDCRDMFNGDIDSSKINPYLISFLRGGLLSAVRLCTFALYQSNLLRITTKVTGQGSKAKGRGALVRSNPLPPDADLRNQMERQILRFYEQTRTAKEIHDELTPRLSSYFRKIEQTLVNAQFSLNTGVRKIVGFGLSTIGILCVLVGLIVYLLSKDPIVPIGLTAGVGAAFALTKLTQLPQQTTLGLSYVEAVRRSCQKLYERRAALTKEDPTFIQLIGVYGLPVLHGTVYQDFLYVFPKASENEEQGGCGGCG